MYSWIWSSHNGEACRFLGCNVAQLDGNTPCYNPETRALRVDTQFTYTDWITWWTGYTLSNGSLTHRDLVVNYALLVGLTYTNLFKHPVALIYRLFHTIWNSKGDNNKLHCRLIYILWNKRMSTFTSQTCAISFVLSPEICKGVRTWLHQMTQIIFLILCTQLLFFIMVLQPFIGPWPLYIFLILYTDCRTPWTRELNNIRVIKSRRHAVA
jgi:hypothetical protein